MLNTLTATAPSKASAAAVAEQANRMMTAAQTATESLGETGTPPPAPSGGGHGRAPAHAVLKRMAKQNFLLAAGVDPEGVCRPR